MNIFLLGNSPRLFSLEDPNKFFSVSHPPPNDEWSTLRQGSNLLIIHYRPLPDIMSPCQSFFPVDGRQTSEDILVFIVRHLMCIGPCWAKCPARAEVSDRMLILTQENGKQSLGSVYVHMSGQINTTHSNPLVTMSFLLSRLIGVQVDIDVLVAVLQWIWT